MQTYIIKFVVLMMLSSQCINQEQDQVTDTNFPRSNQPRNAVTTIRPAIRRGLKKSSDRRLSSNITQKLDWLPIVRKEFGQTNVTNDSMVITNDGLKKLLQSIGLIKKGVRQRNLTEDVKCRTANELLRWYTNDTSKGLNNDQFKDLCPSLLLQIHYRVCRADKTKIIIKKDYAQVWLYSSGAVLLCSLVGLFVVWLIPVLPKSYYNSISQLLIALAVGSLTGDALLHLIPHALIDEGPNGHSHSKGSGNTHNKMVWKALAAFIGIHLFFLTERITILCQNLKSKRKTKIKQLSNENIYLEIPSGDGFEDPNKVGFKSKENKSSSIGKLHWASKSRKYSNSSRELEHASSHNGLNVDPNIGSHLCNRPKNKPHVNSDCPDSMNIELCHIINPYSLTEEAAESEKSDVYVDNKLPINGDIRSSTDHLMIDAKNPDNGNGRVPTNNTNNGDVSCAMYQDNNWSSKEDDKLIAHSHHDSNTNNYESKQVILKQLENGIEIGAGGATVKSSLSHPYHNKPHGHHHGHSHDLSSVKAIAYTVIAGDGLHNFCDGIAIGAAFANDLRGGMSTAIAVFCHELPHELGDFVVLLHAGMSFRTAIFYNLLSSIFCAAGMVIGVMLGAIPSVSSWIFMLTAGMFLYIALVDMMPELSTRRLQGNKLFHRPSILFLWQNLGLLLGAGIMLIIALYEEHMF